MQLPDWLESGTANLIEADIKSYDEDIPDITALPPELEEQAVVKDLLYCLIGAEGTYIKPDKAGVYKIKCIMHESYSSFVEQILPICDNFLIVRQYSEGKLAFEHGRVIHALCAAIRTITSEYIQTIAKLEGARKLTLPLLLTNLQIPSKTLEQLSSLILEIEELRGSPLLSQIDKHMMEFRGSPQSRKLFAYLFDCASVPLLEFIQKWMNDGVVDDPFNEFFIIENQIDNAERLQIQDESFFWSQKFTVNELQKPFFITPSAIESIMLAGKAAAVLAECGLKKLHPIKVTITSIRRETILEAAALEASSRLVNSLRERYRLFDYINMFRSVYLFSRGDWISNFFGVAKMTMMTEKDHVHMPTLYTNLESSLPNICANVFTPLLEREAFADTIMAIHETTRNYKDSVAAKPVTYSLTPWDYFSLTPKVEVPLSLVFNKDVISKYQLLFRMLLIWYRFEDTLSQLWQNSSKIKGFGYEKAREGLYVPDIDPRWEIEKKRHAIHVFVTGFIGYAMASVTHPLWQNLENSLATVSSFDSLIKLHSETLDRALKGLFLMNEGIFKRMMNVASTIQFFIDHYVKYYNTICDTTPVTQKKELAAPLFYTYNSFDKEVSNLLSELMKLSKNEGCDVFEGFIYRINVNKQYLYGDSFRN